MEHRVGDKVKMVTTHAHVNGDDAFNTVTRGEITGIKELGTCVRITIHDNEGDELTRTIPNEMWGEEAYAHSFRVGDELYNLTVFFL